MTDLPAQKAALWARLLGEAQRQLAIAVQAYETALADAVDAPGPMQSRHDTTKKQKSALAGSYAHRISDLRAVIDRMERFRLPSGGSSIREGHVVCLGDTGSGSTLASVERYFIVPAGAATSSEVIGDDNGDALIVSSVSPLGRALLGKELGSVVVVQLPRGPRSFRVIEIA